MDDAPKDNALIDDALRDAALPSGLRFLKWLVIVLTLTMIGGVITVVGLLVTRMPHSFQARPVLPDLLKLPDGARAAAVTAGTGWFAVVTTDDRILIFDQQGKLQQQIAIRPPLPNP